MCRWGRIALDEAQNVKNPSAQAARAVRSLPADSRVALTGTPVENRLARAVVAHGVPQPRAARHAKPFRRRSPCPSSAYRDERPPHRCGGSPARSCCAGSRPTTIIADLPDKIEMKVLCPLTREQATPLPGRGRRHAGPASTRPTGIERRGSCSAALIKLKQVCNHPAHLLGDGSPPRRPVRQARPPRGDARRDHRRRRPGAVLHPVRRVGRRCSSATCRAARTRRPVPARRRRQGERDAMVDALPADAGGPAVFLLSLKAGGTGLNLTAATHVIHFDRWWNPAVEDQATDRAFRIGQRRNVQVHKFVCVGHARGAHRRHDRRASGPWPSGWSAPARPGSPSCRPTSCATCAPLRDGWRRT